MDGNSTGTGYNVYKGAAQCYICGESYPGPFHQCPKTGAVFIAPSVEPISANTDNSLLVSILEELKKIKDVLCQINNK
jgi:hypothetical protein